MALNPTEKGLIVPKAETLTYDRYLKIDSLIGLQNPLSDPFEHDEMLFILIHQVFELWFKQILHEVDFCAEAFNRSEPMTFLRTAGRVKKIQEILVQQIDILETMTPNDFNAFRTKINPASGFQSMQFRMLEFKLGLKDEKFLKYFSTEQMAMANLIEAMHEPTIYDRMLHFFARRGFNIPEEVLQRDVSKLYVANDDVAQEFLKIYDNPSAHYDLYMVLEAMLDLDEQLTLWRYRHVAMVERMIGIRPGTGGTESGAKYLQSTLNKRCFPEIWNVRSMMGSNYGIGGRPS